jgi:hypothetical protein
VDREVTLRLKPKAKSPVFGLLFPDQKVRVIQRRHKWIYVEYVDEIEGVPKYGWAYKKYFHSMSLGKLSKLNISLDKLSSIVPPGCSGQLSKFLTPEERIAITDNWEEINAKRVDLIQRKLRNDITAPEEQELEYLQRLTDKRIRLLAPLPIDRFETLLNEVTRSN